MLRLLIAGFFVMTAVTSSACAPKVDCDELKKKLDGCAEEILWSLKHEAKENYNKHEDKSKVKEELQKGVKELRETLEDKIYKPCKNQDGRAKDAKELNECLEKESCDDFAACLVQFLKK